MLISIYKHADNVLGYDKEYVENEDYKDRDGWHRTQAEAIKDVPVVKPKKKAGRPRKAK